MKKRTAGIIKTVIIGVICVGIVAGFYYYLTNRSPRSVETTGETDEITSVLKFSYTIVLTKKLFYALPGSPRAVIKYYNRILLCLYNETYDDEQYQKLLEKMRALMDEELLENNPQDTFSTQMQNDIAAYKAESKIIATASVCDTDEVAYKKVEGSDCAYVTVSYFLRSTKAYNRANQEYVLRKDENGDWKILGFVALEGDNGDAEK